MLDSALFFGDPAISQAQISPDGRFITFLKPSQGAQNIWFKARTERFEDAKPLTAEKRSIRRYQWSRDSRFVLYPQDAAGDENDHLVAASLGTSADGISAQVRDLTPGSGFESRILAAPVSRPDELIVELNDRDPTLRDVYRLTISTGHRELVMMNTANILDWHADSTGALRAAERYDEQGNTEILRVADGGLWPLTGCSSLEDCSIVGFHPDGRHAYFATNRGKTDLTRLTMLDLQTGAEEPLDEDPEHQADLNAAIISDLNGELMATVYEGDRLRTYPKTRQFAKDLETIRQAVPDGELTFGSHTADENAWVVSVVSDIDPGTVYLYERSTGSVDRLYRSRPGLPSDQMAKVTPVRIAARDGMKLTGYLARPRGAGKGPGPGVLLVHGGPWARDSWAFDATTQFLANRGYAVLRVNYRSSRGYGKRFIATGDRTWGTGTMQHDLTDSAKWLVEQGVAGPAHLGIMGRSYGGYATLAGLAFTPALYAAGVDVVGPSNIVTLMNSTPPSWAADRKRLTLKVGDPGVPADAERMKSQSPLFFADRIRAPLLVVHGQNDVRVKRSEADQIVAAMKKLNRPVQFLVAPDEGHNFAGHLNKLAMNTAIEHFLAKYLGGRVQTEVPPDVAERLEAITVH